jgi:hypothetical protein
MSDEILWIVGKREDIRAPSGLSPGKDTTLLLYSMYKENSWLRDCQAFSFLK